MFTQTVTVYEIIKFKPSKWSRIESMTFKSRSISGATTSPNMDGVLIAYVMVKQYQIYVKPFSCGPTTRRSNGRTHTHTRKHTHTNTLRLMQWARMQCVAFRLKSGYRLTPLDTSWRKVVQLHSWDPLKSWRLVSYVRPVSAEAVSNGLKARLHYTLEMYFIRPFDLEMKANDVDDLDDNW